MGRRRIFSWVTVLFVVLLLVASFGVGFGLGSWTRTSSPAYLPPGNAGQEILQLRAKVDDVAEDARRIDRLVTLLLAVTGIYAVARGLNSYFGLKQILDNAKDESRRILGDMQERYPEFANSQTNLQVIVSELNAVLQTEEDWTKHAYGRASWRKRQEIVMAEMRLTGLEPFRLEAVETYRPRLLRIYQGLGRFYSSKYWIDGSRPDWERASIYFERALRLGEPPADLLKDFGVHLIQLEVRLAGDFPALPAAERRRLEDLRRQAEQMFTESLTKRANEPGALFALGWVHNRSGRYQ